MKKYLALVLVFVLVSSPVLAAKEDASFWSRFLTVFKNKEPAVAPEAKERVQAEPPERVVQESAPQEEEEEEESPEPQETVEEEEEISEPELPDTPEPAQPRTDASPFTYREGLLDGRDQIMRAGEFGTVLVISSDDSNGGVTCEDRCRSEIKSCFASISLSNRVDGCTGFSYPGMKCLCITTPQDALDQCEREHPPIQISMGSGISTSYSATSSSCISERNAVDGR